MTNDDIMIMLQEKSQIEYYRFAALSNLPKSPADAIMQGYEKVPDSPNWYHHHNGEFDNEKYINKKTGLEVVFNHYCNIL